MGSWFKRLQVRVLRAFPHRGSKGTFLRSYPFTVVYMPVMMALIVCVRFIMSSSLNWCLWTQFLLCHA